MTRLLSLEIRQLGNIADGVRLRFADSGAVLLGKNGTGKTTLLNLIVAMCSGSVRLIGQAPFDISYSIRCENGTRVDVDASSHLIAESENREWEPSTPSALHSTSRQIDKLRLRVYAADGSLLRKIASPSVEPQSDEEIVTDLRATETWLMILLSAKDDSRPEARPVREAALELYMLAKAMRRFDESTGFFNELTHESDATASLALHSIRNKITHAQFESTLIPDALANAMCEFYASMEADKRAPLTFAHSDSVPFLKHAASLLGFSHVTASANLDEKAEEDGRSTWRFSPLRFNIGKSSGEIFSHHHLSFGQKRLLSFVYYLEVNQHIVVADELVNGLHHEWIDACLDAMKDRQTFLSSQNPLLFDFLSFTSADEVSSKFIAAECDEQGRFTWTNLSANDSIEFYDVYKTRLQQVSEILRTRGYW